MKKGELSITVVVVAAIALLVLVVLSVIFTTKLGIFTLKSKDCQQVGGVCDQGAQCDADLGYKSHPDAVCFDDNGNPDPSTACCIRIT